MIKALTTHGAVIFVALEVAATPYSPGPAEVLHNSWDQSDPMDAQVILHMQEIDAVQFFHDPLVTGTADIQKLSKTLEIVSCSKTELGTVS